MNNDYFKQYLISDKSILSRYSISALFLISSLYIVWFINDHDGSQIYSLVLAASVFSAIHAGFVPATLVSIIGALYLDYFYVAPVNEVLDSANSYIRIILYSTMAFIISYLISLLKNKLVEADALKEVAQSANTAKENLIAVIAHDLRNPLGCIMGFGNIIKSKTDNKELLNYIDVIINNTSVSLELINDLQDLASLDCPDFTLDNSHFSLTDIIDDIRSSLLPMCSKKDIKIIINNKDLDYFIIADKRLMRRVFLNLLDNAIKYSPMGSHIIVELSVYSDRLLVSVKDHGLGIPNKEINKIFTPFYKTQIRPTAGESSTGLGLATVAAILKAHKSEIKVKSTVGNGTTFIVELAGPISISRPENKASFTEEPQNTSNYL